jgi:toll-like receptor 13
LDSDEDYEYHAFIVYCESDREWVHSTCVKRLEQEGLKVCIHHRDFDIGEPVTGNIEKYMSKCMFRIYIS